MKRTVKMGSVLLVCQMLVGAVFADYIQGHLWNWKSDFVNNVNLATPVNPAADATGSSDVWRYTYNTNDATSAAVRNVGRLDMGLALDNGATGVWGQDTGTTWGTHAYVRGTPGTDVWRITPGPNVSGIAVLSQLVWTAPTDATIRIHGNVIHAETLGNGALWYLDVNQSSTYSALTAGAVYNSSEAIDMTITVAAGDEIVFSADANGGASNDFINYDVVYEIIPEPATVSLLVVSASVLLLARRVAFKKY